MRSFRVSMASAVAAVAVLVAVPLVPLHPAVAAVPAKAVASAPAIPGSSGIPNTTSAINSPQPLSQRVVHYEIDAKLDAKKKSVEATEVLTYRNLTGRPQDTFPFHLYLNAFQPKSTFVTETHNGEGFRGDFNWDEKEEASEEVESLEVEGMGDLTREIQFISPDDGNPNDHTVFQVKLPRAVAPGEEVKFRISFHDQFGEVVARTGYKRDFLLAGQWFPKIGVWWKDAWNCHQFHQTTEFFADFGVFDVKLTVPQNEVVGASGIEVASTNHSDGTKTVEFHGEDIHDFAWTVQPDYRVFTDTFQSSLGPVSMRLLMQPGHADQAARHMKVLRQSMQRFNDWYGPYPYKQITVVDPAHGATQAGGMEYPTFITGDTSWWMPDGLHLVEVVVEHEFGHQYWYGMVATNEFEEAWMDEGINQYTEAKVLDDVFGQGSSMVDMWGVTAGELGLDRVQYVAAADRDPMERFAYKYMSFGSYGRITYAKTATVLHTLEKVIGEDTMRRALHVYFMKYRFTHPTAEDFLKTVEEVSGQNLRLYFDQAVYGTQVMDYEILKAESQRTDWFGRKLPDEKKGVTVYHTEVTVHRKGDFIFPEDVQIRFENGETVHERWDGRDRWIRYSYDKKAKLLSAEIDHDNAIGLDKDEFNNSFVSQGDEAGRHKLVHYWIALQQFAGQLLAWFA